MQIVLDVNPWPGTSSSDLLQATAVEKAVKETYQGKELKTLGFPMGRSSSSNKNSEQFVDGIAAESRVDMVFRNPDHLDKSISTAKFRNVLQKLQEQYPGFFQKNVDISYNNGIIEVDLGTMGKIQYCPECEKSNCRIIGSEIQKVKAVEEMLLTNKWFNEIAENVQQ